MKKILIVDDTAFMQKATSGMLAGKYETMCASSGEEALELCGREKPDLILSDLYMPGMSGLELQKALLEKYGEQIPIMFMTADDRQESEARGLESGAVDFIRKPFNQAVLLRRVDNVMRQVKKVEDLRMVAELDAMTGLLNKAHAQKVFRELCAGTTGTLMMVDLDSFKLVNDLYGHAMGDQVLIRFAEILRSVIRSSDVAGRMGGDEFSVFCRDLRQPEIVEAKARLINEHLTAAAKELMGERMNIPLGASVGAVIVPDEGTDYADLSRKADRALYRVKQNGKHGCFVYHSGQAHAGEEAESSLTTLGNLRTILEERNRKNGAYELGFDGFQCVYRYVVRSLEKHRRSAVLALITLRPSPAPDAMPMDDAMDLFGTLIPACLRRSDAYTKSGSDQYLILLPETDTNAATGLHRILDHWEAEKKGRSAPEVSCETCSLQPDMA